MSFTVVDTNGKLKQASTSSGAPDVSSATGTLAVAHGGTGDTTASGARTNLGLVIGTDVEAHDADLTALAGVSSNGILARTGSGTASARTITASSNISVSNGDGVSGNPTISVTGIGSTIQAWDADLDAVAALSTTGIVARTAAATYVPRTITGSSGVSVSNGDGVAGAPAFSTSNIPVASLVNGD